MIILLSKKTHNTLSSRYTTMHNMIVFKINKQKPLVCTHKHNRILSSENIAAIMDGTWKDLLNNKKHVKTKIFKFVSFLSDFWKSLTESASKKKILFINIYIHNIIHCRNENRKRLLNALWMVGETV